MEISSRSDERHHENVLTLATFTALLEHEEEIVDRIARTPNGGNLFLAHPFQCLADVGVQLSSELRAELIRDTPPLGALSLLAYEAIKNQTTSQPMRVQIRGLFKRKT